MLGDSIHQHFWFDATSEARGHFMRALWAMTFRSMLMAAVCVVVGSGQSRQNQMPTSPSQSRNNSTTPSLDRPDSLNADSMNARMQEQQLRSRNSDRQKRLEADTDKLVELTKSLKDQVEAPEKSLQPNDVGKKAEEIEKLAKSVKDHMKG